MLTSLNTLDTTFFKFCTFVNKKIKQFRNGALSKGDILVIILSPFMSMINLSQVTFFFSFLDCENLYWPIHHPSWILQLS